jgi:hypothetical protein
MAPAHKRVALPCRAPIASAYAHNSDNYSDYSITRRFANLAVQLGLGLLPKRRAGLYSFNCADPLADGTNLTAL